MRATGAHYPTSRLAYIICRQGEHPFPASGPRLTGTEVPVSSLALSDTRFQLVNVLRHRDNPSSVDQSIRLDRSSVKAGTVTFAVTDAAGDKTKHELVVAKTDLADDPLPAKNQQIPESLFKKMGEAEDVASGTSNHLILRFSPGHYVPICNKAGHLCTEMDAVLILRRLIYLCTDMRPWAQQRSDRHGLMHPSRPAYSPVCARLRRYLYKTRNAAQ
ncbi:hypothetical protein OKW42_001323 [Paraburkholderia sp. WC7.3d]